MNNALRMREAHILCRSLQRTDMRIQNELGFSPNMKAKLT
jgi:hypothetical protein